MHDALTVSEYPTIPTWFQARVVTQSGKNIIKQKSSNADVQKVQFDVGPQNLGEVAVNQPRETARLQPPPNQTSPKQLEQERSYPISLRSRCHRVRQQSSSPAS